MFGLPISVWGHQICPYLQPTELLSLYWTNHHLRIAIPSVISAYHMYLTSEIQTLSTHPGLISLQQQIITLKSQAEAHLQYLSFGDIAESMAYRHPPVCVSDTAQVVVLLYLGKQKDYWMAFLRNHFDIYRWLHQFDGFTPTLVTHLTDFEAYLAKYSEEKLKNIWKFGTAFYGFLEEVVKMGRIRKEAACDGIIKKLRDYTKQAESLEKLRKVLLEITNPL